MASKLKAGTTNAQNSQLLSAWCSVNDVLRDISPRWKMVVLHGIAHEVVQFSQLKRAFPTLSDQVLGQRLAELVTEGLVEKAAVAATVPPQIRYSATPKGRALLAIIDALQHWGQQDWSGDNSAAEQAAGVAKLSDALKSQLAQLKQQAAERECLVR